MEMQELVEEEKYLELPEESKDEISNGLDKIYLDQELKWDKSLE